MRFPWSFPRLRNQQVPAMANNERTDQTPTTTNDQTGNTPAVETDQTGKTPEEATNQNTGKTPAVENNQEIGKGAMAIDLETGKKLAMETDQTGKKTRFSWSIASLFNQQVPATANNKETGKTPAVDTPEKTGQGIYQTADNEDPKCGACCIMKGYNRGCLCQGCIYTPFFPYSRREDFSDMRKSLSLLEIKRAISKYKKDEVLKKLDELVQEVEIKKTIGILGLKEQRDAIQKENSNLRKKLEETSKFLMMSGTPGLSAQQTTNGAGSRPSGSQMTGVCSTNASHGSYAAHCPPYSGSGVYYPPYPGAESHTLPYPLYPAGSGAQPQYITPYPLYSAAARTQTAYMPPCVQAPLVLTNPQYPGGTGIPTPLMPTYPVYPAGAGTQTAYVLPYSQTPPMLPPTQIPYELPYSAAAGGQAPHMQPYNAAGVQTPDILLNPVAAGEQTPGVPPYNAGAGLQTTQPLP